MYEIVKMSTLHASMRLIYEKLYKYAIMLTTKSFEQVLY